MSLKPGGVTAHIDCMIVSGFPGIGKTSTYLQMKKDFIGARAVDMDVKDYGTTNGIDVADPAAYVAKVRAATKENACIFVTCDAKVRALMREANLFYIVVAPEFPPKAAEFLPGYRPDPLVRAQYMKRFVDNLGYNSMAAQLLDGPGYDQAIEQIFNDPMPHMVCPNLTKQFLDVIWMTLEQQTRQTVSPNQLMGMANAPKPPFGK